MSAESGCKPTSRPSGWNHSFGVCAPPPWPPAPMEIAGLPHRQRDVGVGRRAVEMGPDAEVRVHGSDVSQDRRIFGQSAAGARADLFQPRATRAPPVARSFSDCSERSIDGQLAVRPIRRYVRRSRTGYRLSNGLPSGWS